MARAPGLARRPSDRAGNQQTLCRFRQSPGPGSHPPRGCCLRHLHDPRPQGHRRGGRRCPIPTLQARPGGSDFELRFADLARAILAAYATHAADFAPFRTECASSTRPSGATCSGSRKWWRGQLAYSAAAIALLGSTNSASSARPGRAAQLDAFVDRNDMEVEWNTDCPAGASLNCMSRMPSGCSAFCTARAMRWT